MPNKKENRILFYISSLTWGLLMTLIGLFVFLFVNIFMRDKILVRSIVAGRICMSLNSRYLGGISLGLFYLVGRSEYKIHHIHIHELGHSIQNAMWGPLFLLVIGIPSIARASVWRIIRKRYFKKHNVYPDYESIWFESNATELGYKYIYEEVIDGLL